MSNINQPETLTELLRTLERGVDLRSLARECGLSVRELRRRLSIWRREILDADAGPAEAPARETGKRRPAPKASARDWPELPSAEEMAGNPLPQKGSQVLEIYTDGASRGNPGPAAVGVVFRQKNGPELCEYHEAIGPCTNNVAEYHAVLAGLGYCSRWSAKKVHLYMDSELIVRQLKGIYQVKSPDLRPLYQQVVVLTRGLKEFEVRHVPRIKNAHADALANRALDES